MEKLKIAINGFGRTGRCFFRSAVCDNEFNELAEVVAVNAGDPKILAHLCKYDSVYGVFNKTVKVEGDTIIVDGNKIKVLNERELTNLNWNDLGVKLVIESSGKFRRRKDAMKHIDAGVEKVLISAPGRDDMDATIVPSVNDELYDHNKHRIISLASCTTNCLAPVAKILNDNFGIEKGYMTTCHAYTMSQRILDGSDRDLRRGRSAAINVVPTTTGAASAIGLVIPELEGKLDGMALRVPVPTGSIIDLAIILNKEVSKEEINDKFKEASESKYKGIVEYCEEPIVSTDVIGNPHSAIVDGLLTSIVGGKGKLAKVYAWYDNEWGYSTRLMDFTKIMAKKWH